MIKKLQSNKNNVAAFTAIVIIVILIGAPAVAENEPTEFKSYEIQLTADPQDGGILTGEGVYEEGTEVNLTIRANEDFIVTGWFENGELISSEYEISFIVKENRDIVAGFERVNTTNNTNSLSMSANQTFVPNDVNDPEISLGDAVDAPHLTWTTGGHSYWFGQRATTYDGVDAARSGPKRLFMEGPQETYMWTTVTGPGTLSFWWMVSSEANFDFLEFYINGIRQDRISGNVSWQQRIYTLSSGTNTLRWRYTKDGAFDVDSDCGWVDQVVFQASSVSKPSKVTLSRPFHNAIVEGSYYEFQWNAASGATKYQLQLRHSSNDAIFKTITLGNVLKRSLFDLPADGTQFRWRVRAGNANGWGEWSSYRTFTNSYGAFNTNLNSTNGYQGWIRRPLSLWHLGSGSMYTSGKVSAWRTARYGRIHYYDLDYTVRMRRTVSTLDPNYIVVRSGSMFKSGSNLWYPGYAFGYRNGGQYRIIRRNANATDTVLQSWTNSSHINKFGYNELRVKVVSNEFKFYINGRLVKTITDSTRKYGGVGVTAWFGGGGTLNIDRASLTRPSSMLADEADLIDAQQQAYNEEALQVE